MKSRINVVLITSAEYNLEFFVTNVFRNRRNNDGYLTWSSGGNPAYSHSGMTIEIDRSLYDREVKKKTTTNKLLSLFKFNDKIVEVPAMVISTSNLTFKNSDFYSYTIQKMIEADVLIMFYDKTAGSGLRGLHDLIEIYCRYLKEIENDEKRNNKTQPCLLIELNKPDSEYKNLETRDVSLADQIDSFRSLLTNDSKLYHIRLEVSAIPPDIYSVIKTMILEIV
jgi:hypothetical protein